MRQFADHVRENSHPYQRIVIPTNCEFMTLQYVRNKRIAQITANTADVLHCYSALLYLESSTKSAVAFSSCLVLIASKHSLLHNTGIRVKG